MRPRFALIGALLVVPVAPAWAQVLTLVEFDLDRGRHAADGRTTPALVDINSAIRISLQKDSLRQRAARLAGEGAAFDSLLTRAERLQRAARRGLDALATLRAPLDSLARQPLDAARRRAFQQAAGPVAAALMDIDTDLAPEGTPLRDLILAALDTIPPQRSLLYRAQVVFQVAAGDADRLRAGVDSVQRTGGVALLLGAWIWTRSGARPLHLPGFDDYPEGEFVAVDRWAVVPTDEQRTKLQALVAEAQDLRARRVDVTAGLRDGLRTALAQVADSGAACVVAVDGAIQSARARASGALRDALGTGETALRDAHATIAGIAAKYGRGGAERLRDPMSTAVMVAADVQALAATFRDLRSSLLEVTNSARASGLVTRDVLVGTLESCATTLAAGVRTLGDELGPLSGPLAAAQRIETGTLEFGQEVLRLDIANAPDEARLDLKWTGARAEGDVVIVRVGLAQPDSRPTPIEEHQLVLHRVIPHLRVAVQLIFADPVPDGLSAALPARFQPGASSSVLYTWGSRRWAGYNSFWRLGIGANIAALDLNRDGTQELGIGLALSALAERAQIGLGYDVGQDASYWFFALQVPLLGKTLAAPGGGSGEAP